MTVDQVLQSLSKVIDPDLKRNLVELNMIQNVFIDNQNVKFDLILTTPACPLKDYLKEACSRQLKRDFGENLIVEINLSSKVAKVVDDVNLETLKDVRNIIAVVSGKGGVGKSTIAVNLAVGLALEGAQVGLMDGDIYGPSIPTMMGLEGQIPLTKDTPDKQLIEPIISYGVKVMSIGFYVAPDTSLIWRGPMASKYLQQLITSTHWGELDYLIFDMPPGTGDLHLTLVQLLPISGVVIVSTPQKVALADARKAIAMMREPKINVPIIGIVENMAYLQISHISEKKYYIFGKERAKLLADEFDIPFLGQIPIDQAISVACDNGVPAVIGENTLLRNAMLNFCYQTTQQLAMLSNKLIDKN